MSPNTRLPGRCFRAVLVCVAVLTLPLAAAPWQGGGAEHDPYQIADADDLKALASDPNYYTGYYFILTADIDLAGLDGRDYIIAPDTDNSSDGFDGPVFGSDFEGNYRAIRNLTIDTMGANDDFLALFGGIDADGQVRNLGLAHANITGGALSDYVGTLVAANSGSIEKCYATGSVGSPASAGQFLGGLVGLNAADISNCYADVVVTAGPSSQHVGGFAGNFGISVARCYASGLVSGGANVGGFAGSGISPFFPPSYCYFLHPSDGGGPDNGLGFALLEEDMQDQASFVTWDFFGEAPNGTEEIWKMDNFPILAWQVPVNLQELDLLAQHWMLTNCSAGDLCETVDWYRDAKIDRYDFYQLTISWLEPVVAIETFEIGDDFETGDFSYMPWVMDGNEPWVIVGDVVYQGDYAAKSGTIGDSQTSSMEFTVDNTADYDSIGFYVKASTEADADKLRFYDNGDSQGLFNISGELDWTHYSFNIGPGDVHTFKWSYEKDANDSAGSDCVWIDMIEFVDLY